MVYLRTCVPHIFSLNSPFHPFFLFCIRFLMLGINLFFHFFLSLTHIFLTHSFSFSPKYTS
uniref:Uncharacterized protein n=1 Tax=Octopus bimaculoides TaxID=37653 RepID=A0A0L8I9N6_OCTBM